MTETAARTSRSFPYVTTASQLSQPISEAFQEILVCLVLVILLAPNKDRAGLTYMKLPHARDTVVGVEIHENEIVEGKVGNINDAFCTPVLYLVTVPACADPVMAMAIDVWSCVGSVDTR